MGEGDEVLLINFTESKCNVKLVSQDGAMRLELPPYHLTFDDTFAEQIEEIERQALQTCFESGGNDHPFTFFDPSDELLEMVLPCQEQVRRHTLQLEIATINTRHRIYMHDDDFFIWPADHGVE